MKFNRITACLDMFGCPNRCKHCWIGTNVVICKGVHIGDNCTIGAGVVVRENVADGSIVS